MDRDVAGLVVEGGEAGEPVVTVMVMGSLPVAITRRYRRVMAEIVVIGAGSRGLATAGPLQRRGHSVTVIEERNDTGRARDQSIWPNALAALDARTR